jgi:enoyl-CoA hydratase/carnithine racemase
MAAAATATTEAAAAAAAAADAAPIRVAAREGGVRVLEMRAAPDNRFNPRFISAFHAALDAVENDVEARALVTVGLGRFYSNGLDVEWMGAHADEAARFLASFQALLARVLAFPLPTVAALNGHAYAGGLFLALAHDMRVMRGDRGFACLPEVDLGMVLGEGLSQIAAAKLPQPVVLRDAALFGAKFSAAEALRAGMVDQVCEEARVLPEALARASALAARGFARPVLGRLKRDLYASTLRALTEGDTSFVAPPRARL